MNERSASTVSVITPCRNERDYIEPFIRSLRAQRSIYPVIEFLIADGMSDDGTREVLRELTNQDAKIRTIDNPSRIVPTGLNAAIRAARGDIIVRMDVHTEYAADYIEQCVRVLEETAADNVGGAWRTRGKTYLQKAIALAFQSAFSSGGADSHAEGYEGPVDSVYLGCWRRSTLLDLGLFDEELVRNQDDELNLRLSRRGGRIWQSRAIRSWYYPRSSLVALFRQYLQYGYWKARVLQKHRLPASIRHIVPGCFVGTLLLLGAASWFSALAQGAFLLVFVLYLCANLTASLSLCSRPCRLFYLPMMPLIFAVYHFGYGYGFLRGAFDFWVCRKGGDAAFTKLTRSQKT